MQDACLLVSQSDLLREAINFSDLIRIQQAPKLNEAQCIRLFIQALNHPSMLAVRQFFLSFIQPVHRPFVHILTLYCYFCSQVFFLLMWFVISGINTY